MTIASTARKAGPLLGNGTATTFPFTFKVFAEGDIKVVTAGANGVESVRVLGSDYSVSLNANQDTSPGGTVTYPISGVPLATGSVLSIVGDVDYDQPLDLPSGGNFSPLALENQLDRTTMQVQQLHEEMGRTAKLPVTSLADADSLVADIVRLADSVDNLDTVAGSIAGVDTVASNIADVNTVAAVAGAVAATGSNIAAVVAVGNDLLEPVSEINTVASDIANVNTVGTNIADVNTVAGIAANVTAVASNVADIVLVADHVADVTNFADVYQGAKAADPTLRNDGSALQPGDLYFSTTENALRAYSGTVWVAGAAGTVSVQTFSGDGVETAFVLAAAPPSENNTQVYIGGVYQQKSQYGLIGASLVFNVPPPAGTDNLEVVTVSSLALGETDAALVSFTPAGGGATPTNVQTALRALYAREVNIGEAPFNADPTGAAFSTAALQSAISSLRANPVSILDTIGGVPITVYSSGVVNIPRGVFKIAPDTLKIYQDLGLTLRGQGSRRTNNAVRAATTLLISGASSGFGIQAYRSGGRGLTIEDLDICYETAAFTGSVLDVVDSPGITLNRVFLGTYGLTGGTRLQTAAACLRSTYDEFITANQCVFDGATHGWWSDDTRTELGNTFGGSNTSFNQCVFYDFIGDQITHSGARTRVAVALNGCVFNPISVNCSRSINLANVEGICITGGNAGGSVANKAAVEWMRLANCTGFVRGFSFDDMTQAGTFDGMLDLSNNRVYCTQGFEIKGGVITGKGNEFSKTSSGWKISPEYALCFDIGPDLAKADVAGAYNIPVDSALISGRINYNSAGDASSVGIINASARVSIENVDKKQTAVSAAAYTFNARTDTGRTIVATGTAAQTFNLPNPIPPGVRFRLLKASTVACRVDAAAVGQLYVGVGTAKTSVVAGAASDVGGSVEIEAYGTAAWIVRYNGNWALS